MPSLLMNVTGDTYDRVVVCLPHSVSPEVADKIAANIAAEMLDVLRGVGREDVAVKCWAEA